MNRNERQYQAIENWKSSKCKGTIVAATGFGKTKMALDAIERVVSKNPTVAITIVVPTKILQDQWLDKLDEKEILADVLVLNTAAKKSFNCDFLIVDEIHKSAAELMSKMFLNCHPKFILGLTATYERLDGREKIVLDKYAPVCDTITIDEATSNGWLSPYKEYKVLLNVDLSEYDAANREFNQHFAFFDWDFSTAMDCVTDFWKQQVYARKLNCRVDEVKAHAFAWNRALRARKSFIANHSHKLEVAKHILEMRPNCKAITFNSSIKQCEAYKSGYVLHSGHTKKKNQMTLAEFDKTADAVLHTSKMADEGLDCKGLSLAIITGFNSSKTSKTQRVGRVIRFEEGKEAEVFTLILKGTVEENWYAKSMEGMDYIEINEEELEEILNNRSLSNKHKIRQNASNNNYFRF